MESNGPGSLISTQSLNYIGVCLGNYPDTRDQNSKNNNNDNDKCGHYDHLSSLCVDSFLASFNKNDYNKNRHKIQENYLSGD